MGHKAISVFTGATKLEQQNPHCPSVLYFPEIAPETCFGLMVLASVRRLSFSGDGVKSAEQTHLEIKKSIQC